MDFIFKFCFWFIVAVLVWHILTKKYLNPYKLYMVIGKKGSGKSTMLTRLAYEHIRKGWKVYTTEGIPGTYKLNYSDIGKFDLPAGSVLLVDEVGMVWDNRKYKEFPDYLRDWFKYQRHEGVKVYLFSQTFDVDKKIRDLTDNMYLVTNVGRVFAYAKRIIKKPNLVKPSAEGPARLDDELKFDSFFWFWCGSRMITFIPRYAKLFNSHERLGLPSKEYEYIPPLNVPRSLLGKRKRSNARKICILLRSFCSSIPQGTIPLGLFLQIRQECFRIFLWYVSPCIQHWLVFGLRIYHGFCGCPDHGSYHLVQSRQEHADFCCKQESQHVLTAPCPIGTYNSRPLSGVQ